jgi:hypothetical protein
MTTVDQWLKALAVVESADNPEAWGDAGRAMGRWQVHPDRLWSEMHAATIKPKLGETWDQLVGRVLRTFYTKWGEKIGPITLAMYWHVGHICAPADDDWDLKYAARFGAALQNAEEDMP